MWLVSLENAKPNMRLAKPVVDVEGRKLLNKGAMLTDANIGRLFRLGVFHLYVEGHNADPVFIKEKISEVTRRKCLQVTKEIMTDIKTGKTFFSDRVVKIVEELMNEVLANPGVISGLNDIRIMKEYTFNHSVSVAVLALLLGDSLEYDHQDLLCLGTGALLHDVGKSKISNSIIEKPGQLTPAEFNIIKAHTELGYLELCRCNYLDEEVALIARQHHEKWDGSGYPKGLRGSEIHPFAQIVAICDVYDALTSDRVYRRRFLPVDAIDIMAKERGKSFDEKLLTAFLNQISPFPEGALVKLRSGKLGIVLEQNPGFPARPKIRIIDLAEKPYSYEVVPRYRISYLDLVCCQDDSIIEVMRA